MLVTDFNLSKNILQAKQNIPQNSNKLNRAGAWLQINLLRKWAQKSADWGLEMGTWHPL